MKRKFTSFISLGLLLCLSMSLFSCYPAMMAIEQTADSGEIEEIASDVLTEVEITSISTNTRRASLFMKVNSNYMLNKNSRAAIYDQDGFIYGSPYKINGVVYVPARPIARDFLGGGYGWANDDGSAFNLTASGKTAVVTVNSVHAVYNGTAITLDNPPLLVKGDGCEREYLVVGLSDVEKIFPGYYVTYDEMGLIGISASKNIFNRDNDLNDMVNVMKSFIYDKTSESELYSKIEENTNGFDHPYLIGSDDKFDYMHSVYIGEVEDEVYMKILERQVTLAQSSYELFTTLPRLPANPTFKVYAYERDPGKYKALAFEITNPFSGINNGQVWSDSKDYTYHKGPDENGYCWPSVLHDEDNGPHYNDGYDYAGGRNSAGVSYAG